MSKRHPNPRYAKTHGDRTFEEVTSVFGVHRNIAREWFKRGLPTNSGRRAMLILGADLLTFLNVRRAKNKRTCKPRAMYCVRCWEPRAPAGDVADYQAVTTTLGNLIAMCPAFDSMVYLRNSMARLGEVRARLDMYHRCTFASDGRLIAALCGYIELHNCDRRHSSMDYRTPMEIKS
jgi:hypothetical protein